MTIQLTDEQLEVVATAGAFLRRAAPRRPWFTLHGLAGTGKTTVLSELARRYPGALLTAFTGKAAHVLRTKTGLETTTLHSAIFTFGGVQENEETGKKEPIFYDKEETGLRDRVVLLDECSTVGTYLAEKLLATGARVVACGDPGQLPPVRDAQFFENPDAVLRTVHRQAWDSAVIRQAHAVRARGTYAEDGEDFRVVKRTTPELLRWADVALCWRNATRQALNLSARRAKGITNDRVVQVGEPVMCLRNDHRLKLWNGAIYTVTRDRAPGADLHLEADGRQLRVINATFEGFDADFETLRDVEEITPFALAHAATVHKSQGSEWPRVLLVDECRGEQARQLLYTGITRAAKSVTVVSTR